MSILSRFKGFSPKNIALPIPPHALQKAQGFSTPFGNVARPSGFTTNAARGVALGQMHSHLPVTLKIRAR